MDNHGLRIAIPVEMHSALSVKGVFSVKAKLIQQQYPVWNLKRE